MLCFLCYLDSLSNIAVRAVWARLPGGPKFDSLYASSVGTFFITLTAAETVTSKSDRYINNTLCGARLAQSVRSWTGNREVPGPIPSLAIVRPSFAASSSDRDGKPWVL